MIDRRFFHALGPKTIGGLTDGCGPALGALIRGNREVALCGVASLAAAGPQDVAFYEGADPQAVQDCQAGLILASAASAPLTQASGAQASGAQASGAQASGALFLTPYPRAAFAAICNALFALREHAPNGPMPGSVRLEGDVRIGCGAVIGENVEIGSGSVIGPNAVIGPGVSIGRGTHIGANAVVLCALLGDGVVIGAGSVLGDTGFGVAQGPDGPVLMPHLGRVIVQDRACIGALSSIDRGLLQDTIIGEDAKIDNHCQIAHNVQIGAGAVLAAFAGISGSAKIGEGARLGGRVGIADHIEVGAGASLAAGAGLMHPVPAGATWGGFPAKPIQRWMREIAWLKKATGQKHAE